MCSRLCLAFSCLKTSALQWIPLGAALLLTHPMRSPQLTVGAAIGAVMVLVPLPAHIRVRNVSVLSMIACIFSTNLINVVNTLLWAGNVRDIAPVWCDIITNVQLFAYFSVAWAGFCACKYLEWVSSSRGIRSDRKSRLVFELVLCLGLPLLAIPFRYISSTNRYVIVEDFGCFPAFHPSLPFIMLISVPQLMICTGTLILASVAICHIVRRHVSLATHLCSFRSALTTSRFIRLLAMCLSMGFWGVFVNSVILYDNISAGLHPWPGWAAVHTSSSHILTVPAIAQSPAFRATQMLTYWVYTVTAYIFFAVFGFGEDVREEYHKYWAFLTRTLGCRGAGRQTDVEGALKRPSPSAQHPSIRLSTIIASRRQIEKGQLVSHQRIPSFDITSALH